MTYRVRCGDTIDKLTSNLADRINSDFLPVVSGYSVTFKAPWPSEVTTTVVLSGTPAAGEIYSVLLTLGGNQKKFSHTVATGETLETIALALADLVNADAVGNLSANTAGVSLIIVNSAGNTDKAEFQIANAPANTPGAYVIDATDPSTKVITLNGRPIPGEVWSVRLNVGTETSFFTRTVTASDTLASIASALAASINVNGSADFVATTEGNALIIVKRTAGAFVAAFEIKAATVGAVAATTAAVTLTGHPVSGEVWALTIGALTFAVTVDGSIDTLPEIGGELARMINDEPAAPDFSATTQGDTLLIVNRAGAPFTTTFKITPASGFTIDANTAIATVVKLTGSVPAAGNDWTVLLTSNGATAKYSHTVVAGDTLSTIAVALAVLINADNVNAADFTATADGDSLVIVNRAGTPFTLTNSFVIDPATADTTTVSLSGVAVVNEIWTITLTLGGVAMTFSHTVGSSDTLASIATALATAINTSLLPEAADFSATTEGSALLIVNRAGAAFGITAAVDPAVSLVPTSIVSNDPSKTFALTAVLNGLPGLSETWSVTLNGHANSVVVGNSYMVGTTGILVDTLAEDCHCAGRRDQQRRLSDRVLGDCERQHADRRKQS